jgi:serine/threonine-protein kinase
VKHCERLLALEARLPAFLAGKEQPAGGVEQLLVARLCNFRGLHAATAHFYTAAFADQPKIAADLRHQERYRAACAAALAAANRGADTGKLSGAERARLRRQALTWLRADLAAWAKVIKSSARDRPYARSRLRDWQRDSDLAGLRDAGALAGLPPEEQQACLQLWKEVAELAVGRVEAR